MYVILNSEAQTFDYGSKKKKNVPEWTWTLNSDVAACNKQLLLLMMFALSPHNLAAFLLMPEQKSSLNFNNW